MRFLRVPLFTLIYYLLLHLGFCKAYRNCLVALIKITTVHALHTVLDLDNFVQIKARKI